MLGPGTPGFIVTGSLISLLMSHQKCTYFYLNVCTQLLSAEHLTLLLITHRLTSKIKLDMSLMYLRFRPCAIDHVPSIVTIETRKCTVGVNLDLKPTEGVWPKYKIQLLTDTAQWGCCLTKLGPAPLLLIVFIAKNPCQIRLGTKFCSCLRLS